MQQQPPQLGGVPGSVVCATEPQASVIQRTQARLNVTALTVGPPRLQTVSVASQGPAFGIRLLFK